MENLYFKNKGELDSYIDKHSVKELGHGIEGKCVLLDNGYTAKVFHSPKNPDLVLQCKNVEIGSFQFSEAAAIVGRDALAGFAVNAPGLELGIKVPKDQKIDVMGEHLQVLADDLYEAGMAGILIRDFFEGNIVYDYNKFTVIDMLTCLYIPCAKCPRENLKTVLSEVYTKLLDDFIFYNPMCELYYGNNRLAFYNPRDYLQEVKKRVIDFTGEEVVTFEDAEKAVLRRVNM